jgi:hypothetical protein
MSTNPYAPPAAKLEPTGADAPPLWNPGAAASWSILLTPIFGAWLHMKNWEALREPEQAKRARSWMVMLATVQAALMLCVALPFPWSESVLEMSRPLGLGLLVGWYLKAGRPQLMLVRERYGSSYPRQPWGRPLLIGLSVWIGAVVLMIAVAAAQA